jgi:hypothetical protein
VRSGAISSCADHGQSHRSEETLRKPRAYNDMLTTLSYHCVYRLPGNSYHSRSLLTPSGMYYTMVLQLSSIDCVDRCGSFASLHPLCKQS